MVLKFLEQSANDLVEKFKYSTAINDWEIKLLKDLLVLRDAEILAKFHMEKEVVDKLSDTIPPSEPPTLIDNSWYYEKD